MIDVQRLTARWRKLAVSLGQTAGLIAMQSDQDAGLSADHVELALDIIFDTLQETLDASEDEVADFCLAAYDLWLEDTHKTGKLQSPSAKDAFERPGVVYILRCGSYYKIGMTRVAMTKRVANLQTGSPHRLEVITVITSDDPADLERRLHSMFAAKRFEGEWFALDPGDVELLKRIQ